MANQFKINQVDVLDIARLIVRNEETHQTIDGFGVNINPLYWENGKLESVMELLHQDLGAELYRLDVFGQSNWIDPSSGGNKELLNETTYRQVYRSAPFQDAWAMARYLNSKGIKPYLNASGLVPAWMCGGDGKTLEDYESFSEMMASMLHWARHEENIQFELFGPLNETDAGPPEGPLVSAEEYAKCMEILVDVLDRRGLSDVKLVVAEQSLFSLDYIVALMGSRKLDGRIGVFGMHDYHSNSVKSVPEQMSGYIDGRTRFWMTEYGDLDVTGEYEWEVAWISTHRLIGYLLEGAQAALAWDAYDNYHDHDKAWSLYGLIRSSRSEYTPKKRFYAAKQVFKFVKPGSSRVTLDFEQSSLHAAAFWHDDHGTTVVGMNQSDNPVTVQLSEVSGRPFELYFTNETLHCAKAGLIAIDRGTASALIPAKTIFTFTQSQ
ncbi:O-Glycosyl hydrolase [Paenibacillus sp. BC26]|nr:O-Glycosyl hydrolase [Paenibacillus sp. BC26]